MQLFDGLFQGIEKLNFIFCESRFLLVRIGCSLVYDI